MKHIEFTQSGIKCDNPECGWRDDEVNAADYDQWLNQACPKCGSNLLTEEDYNEVKKLEAAINFINTLSEEDVKQLGGLMSIDEVMAMPQFKDMQGLDKIAIDSDDKVIIEAETHNGLRFTSIKKDENDNNKSTT